MSTDSERQLVSRIRSDDASAFETLYREYASGLLDFAYTRLHSRELAEDLVQELFLTLWKYRDRWVLTGGLKAYLFRALRNHIIDWRRAMAVRPELRSHVTDASGVTEALAVVPSALQADDQVYAGELMQAFTRAVASLPPRCRESYLLVRQEGMSYAEAAHVLGVTVKAIEMNMVRAVQALRQQLAEWRE